MRIELDLSMVYRTEKGVGNGARSLDDTLEYMAERDEIMTV